MKSESFNLVADPDDSNTEFRTSRAETPEALAGVHAESGWVLLIADEASGVPDVAAHLNIVQKQQALRNKWSHLKILAEDINHDRYLKLRKTLPNPHFWSAALGTIYQGQP